MWLDRNKRMKTVYNYLNLPARISDTITSANKIEYVYTSAEEKLKQRLSTGTSLLYLGNYVYTLDGTANGITVKYILTQEGMATNSAGTYTYEYFRKDHLGSTRVSFNVPSTTAVIVQQDDYYTFGMLHKPQTTATSDNRYLFNGKELQNNLLGGVNLDLYNYSSRYYDPQIGRFTAADLLAENTEEISPYHYGLNNLVTNIDPTGMWTETAKGYTTYNKYEIPEFMRSIISQFSITTQVQERKEKKKDEEMEREEGRKKRELFFPQSIHL